MTDKKIEIYATTYCNMGHRLSDGKPVGHECRVIPPKALQMEMEGDFDGAIELLANAPRVTHRGVPGK